MKNFCAVFAILIVISILALITVPVHAIDVTINTYSDAEHTKPSTYFGNGSVVYFTAYNGVSCCDSKSVLIKNLNITNVSIIMIANTYAQNNTISSSTNQTANMTADNSSIIINQSYNTIINQTFLNQTTNQSDINQTINQSYNIDINRTNQVNETESVVFVTAKKANIMVIITDLKGNGVYSGYFRIGNNPEDDPNNYTPKDFSWLTSVNLKIQESYALNEFVEQLYLENHHHAKIYISLTPLSNGTQEIIAEYSAPQPVNLSAEFSNGVILNWTNASDESGIDHYNIYRSTNEITPKNMESAMLFISYKNSFYDKNIDDGVTYYYAVVAIDKIGNLGDLSNTIIIIIPDITPPKPITDLHTTAIESGKIELKWSKTSDNVGVSQYLLYRSESNINDINSAILIANLTNNNYLDEQTNNNKKYYYAVIAIDAAGNRAKISNTASAIADSEPPSRISDLRTATEKIGLTTLSWNVVRDVGENSNKNANLYKVYRSRFKISNKSDIIEMQPVMVTKNLSYDEISDESAYFVVTAVDDAGNEGDISNIVRIEPDTMPPQPITNLTIATDQNKKIILKWHASTSSDVKLYNVYRSEQENISYNKAYAYTSSNELIDLDVVKDRTYYYVVRAVDNSGNEENNSFMVNVTAIDSIVELDITYPKNNIETAKDKIAIIGQTDSDARVEIKTIINSTEYVNNAVIDKNGIFIGFAPLIRGANALEIKTTDNENNIKTQRIFLKNNLDSNISNEQIQNALKGLDLYIENNTFTANTADMLADHDSNIDRDAVKNYITGKSALGMASISSGLLFIAIIVVIIFLIFSRQLIKRDLLGYFKSRIGHDIKREEQLKKEKDDMQSIFQKFVDPQIVQRIIGGRKTEKCIVSILIVDIRGFTGLFEEMKADDIGILMDKYIDRMVTTIRKNKGIVQKIAGGMVYAFFGIDDQKDHATKAFQTAIEMKKQLNALNNELMQMGYNSIEVGIAISSGDAIIKFVGSESSMLYFTAVGEPISIASKLEEYAKAGEILVSENTYDLIKPVIKTAERTTISIRNRSKSLIVYRIMM